MSFLDALNAFKAKDELEVFLSSYALPPLGDLFERVTLLFQRTPQNIAITPDKFAQYYDQRAVNYMLTEGVQSVLLRGNQLSILFASEKSEILEAKGMKVKVLLSRSISFRAISTPNKMTAWAFNGVYFQLNNWPKATLINTVLEPRGPGATRITSTIKDPFFGMDMTMSVSYGPDGKPLPDVRISMP